LLLQPETDTLDPNGLAILRVITLHQLGNEFTHDCTNIFGYQIGSVFFGEGLQLSKAILGFMVHEQ